MAITRDEEAGILEGCNESDNAVVVGLHEQPGCALWLQHRKRAAVCGFFGVVSLVLCAVVFYWSRGCGNHLQLPFQEVESKALMTREQCGTAEPDLDYVLDENLSFYIDIASPEDCCSKCQDVPSCQVWTWVSGANSDVGNVTTCWLKAGGHLKKVRKLGSVSGFPQSELNVWLQPESELIPPDQTPPGAALQRSDRHRVNMQHTKVQTATVTTAATMTTITQESTTTKSSMIESTMPEVASPEKGVTALQLPQIAGDDCRVGKLPVMSSYKATGSPLQVRVLTYNLYWWNLMGIRHANGGAPFKIIDDSGRTTPYDVMAFQECEDAEWVLERAGLIAEYVSFSGLGTKTTAICMAFRKASWELLAHGSGLVAEDARGPQYFGKRAAQWARLRHMITGKILFFMNHHGPLPVNSGGSCGGLGTVYNLLTLIRRNAHEGDAIILAGDFNADTASSTVTHLEQRLHRAFTGTALGGIDSVFSNLLDSSVVSTANLGGGGSDHDALSIILELGGLERDTMS